MDEQTSGIILRTFPMTETSLIVRWLTPDLGRVNTVARGARRNKSSFQGKLDLYFTCEFSLQRSRHSDLHALKEASLLSTRPALRQDIAYLCQAAYAASLIERNIETDSPVPEVFALFNEFLEALPTNPVAITTIFAFEIKFLAACGLEPPLAQSPLHEGTRQLLEQLQKLPCSAVHRLKSTPIQAQEIGQFLFRFIHDNLSPPPPSRKQALEIY
jgi:DNA repair protein RecO (recombination protein O)